MLHNVNIRKVQLSDMSSFWRGTCTCKWDHEALCGVEVHQMAKGHILREHGVGVIEATNYRMEVK